MGIAEDSRSVPTIQEIDTLCKKPHEGLVYPPLNQPQPPVPRRVELDSGMIIYLLEDHELPIVDISVQIRTGAIYEPEDKIGLAAITGAVMRTGGTTSKTGDELDEILENLAASVEVGIGGDAGTASMSVLKEDLDTGLAILADVLMNPAFREDKIELEKVQHRSSIARRNDSARSITSREFQKLIHGADSPYARTTEYDTINSITRDDLVAFHAKYFRPNNTILGVLGDFNSEEILDKIRVAFKGWQPRAIDLPEKPKVSEGMGRRVGLVTKDDVNQTNIRMGHVGWLRSNEDYPALVVGCQILGIGFSSRLVNSIRVEKGLAYSVGNNYGAGYDVPGVFLIACATKSESTVTATEAILAEVERMRAEEVSDEELKQAIDGFMNSSVFDYDSKGEILSRALRYAYYDYPQDFVEQLMAGIRNVTKSDVQRVVAKYMHPDQFTILAVGKASDFDKPLDSLGEVTEIDITIPTPSPEPVPEAGEGDVAKAREILAAATVAHGGLENLKQVKTLVSKGKINMNTPAGEMTMDGEVTVALPSKARYDLTIQAMGMTMSRVLGEESAWMASPQGSQTMPEVFAQEGRNEIFRLNPPLLTYVSGAEVPVQHLGEEDVNGKMADVILVRDTSAGSIKLFIDQESKYIVKKEFQALGQQGEPVQREEFYSDHRDISGVKIAFSIISIDNGEKAAEVTLSDVTVNAEVDESIFEQ
jgi:predicted Zn-dependent peptidase